MKKTPVMNILMGAGLLLSTAGCSWFAPWREDVVVDSEPQGAQVIIPGQRLTTPCTITVPCDRGITVVIKKEGYETSVHTIRHTLGKCGTLDVIGAVIWLVPAIGLFSPGASTLEQHTIYAPLTKSAPVR